MDAQFWFVFEDGTRCMTHNLFDLVVIIVLERTWTINDILRNKMKPLYFEKIMNGFLGFFFLLMWYEFNGVMNGYILSGEICLHFTSFAIDWAKMTRCSHWAIVVVHVNILPFPPLSASRGSSYHNAPTTQAKTGNEWIHEPNDGGMNECKIGMRFKRFIQK